MAADDLTRGVDAVVHAALLRDLPFSDPDRLVWMYNLRTERDRAPLSIPDLNDYKRDANAIEGFAPFTNWTASLAEDAMVPLGLWLAVAHPILFFVLLAIFLLAAVLLLRLIWRGLRRLVA